MVEHETPFLVRMPLCMTNKYLFEPNYGITRKRPSIIGRRNKYLLCRVSTLIHLDNKMFVKPIIKNLPKTFEIHNQILDTSLVSKLKRSIATNNRFFHDVYTFFFFKLIQAIDHGHGFRVFMMKIFPMIFE